MTLIAGMEKRFCRRSNFNGLEVIGDNYIGVLEYWSIGVLEKAKARGSTRIRPFITPLLHHSITPFLRAFLEQPEGGSLESEHCAGVLE
jgi:hypothetical protein